MKHIFRKNHIFGDWHDQVGVLNRSVKYIHDISYEKFTSIYIDYFEDEYCVHFTGIDSKLLQAIYDRSYGDRKFGHNELNVIQNNIDRIVDKFYTLQCFM